jgi:AcrR family transcriptional regulator
VGSWDERRRITRRERVLRGAVAVADASGIGALTIRSLAREIGARPMSLYHYVTSKDEILGGIVDLVFSEIELPSAGGHWQSEMRRRAISARRVLRRHPWAIGLLEPRTNPGAATLRHHDATIATLRGAGFSVAMTAHAYALLDSYVYGSRSRRPRCPSTPKPSPNSPNGPASRSPPTTTPTSSRWRPSTSSNPATTPATNSRSGSA